MGGRLTRVGARQHPDLTLSPDDTRALRAVVLTLLTVDGIISAVLAAFFLPLRLGAVPFPISALLSGALNAGGQAPGKMRRSIHGCNGAGRLRPMV